MQPAWREAWTFPVRVRGYDKKYHIPIFSITDLPDQEHTIRIEVCGEKAEDASDCYIVLDYLRVLTGERTEPVKFMINQAFSFLTCPGGITGNRRFCRKQEPGER